MSERWLVCGGRGFKDRAGLDAFLSALAAERGMPNVLIHGRAVGADQLAGRWAERAGIPVIAEPVTREDWHRFGRAAGPIRNQRMIDRYGPTLVIAFPGGPGTADMTQRAEKAGLPVITIKTG